MTDSLFCPKCGMLKNNCICGKSERKKSSKPSSNLYSYTKKRLEKKKLTEKDIPESYVIEDHIWPKEKVEEFKTQFPYINEEILENFPFEQPRVGQLDIIQDIQEAIQQGYKYIILEAGTGTGKSAVTTTLAKLYGSAYILTMTKQLQAQYADEFGFPLVKGRSNFGCMQDNFDSTCNMGTCKTTPVSHNFSCLYGISKNPTLDAGIAFDDSFGNSVFFQSENHCNYWQQKANAINSPISLMNYDYAILELNYVKHFGTRSLLILDEAHNIENKLMRTMEVNLYNTRIQKDINKVISAQTLKDGQLKDWILEVEALQDAYEDIELVNIPANKADRIRSTVSKLKNLRVNLEKEPKNWVIDADEYGVSFKPLKVHHYAKNNLLKYGDVCIFMSATILSHKMFSKWLGLDPDEVYHIKVDSPFNPKNRPVSLSLAGKMSKSRIKQTAPKTIPILQEILEKHKNDKGLIHTNSYKCQQYIKKHLPNSRLISHTPRNREAVLKHFEEDENPLVLVSPSMSEGVDLPYDKCRFQVIYKIPFPYLGDKQVYMRQKRDQRWYAYKTVMTLMQAYGRGMRAEDDSCFTYILDSDVNMLLRSPIYRSLVPEFFKEAIINL